VSLLIRRARVSLRRMTYSRGGILLFCALVVGCGGKSVGDDSTTDGGTDGSTTGDAQQIPPDGNVIVVTDGGAPLDYCKAAADRAARCMTDSFTKAECEQQLACYQKVLRPENYTPLLTCLANRPCGTSDDRCVAEQAQKYISDPAVSDWVKTCIEKRNSCTGAFPDDYCGYEFGLMNDTLRNNMKTCLARSCVEISTCFNTVFAALGCNK
jgi:hypothetical protein